MRITPLDIQKHRFRMKVWGHDPAEVRTFLMSFAEQYEKVIRENHQYREQIALLQETNKEYQDREEVLKTTLLSAQSAADDIRAAARREAEVVVKEAELTAEKMMDVARERIGRYEGRLVELKTLKRELLEQVRAMSRRHQALLADWDEADEVDNLKFLDAPRRSESAE